MQVTSEQSFTKLRIMPKDFADMTDDEVELFLNDVIRPERGKTIKGKASKAKTTTTKRTEAISHDDLA